MPIKKILKMYGNGFLTRQIADFPANATDDDYVIKTFSNAGASAGYRLTQAVDPSDSGDLEDPDIRGLIDLGESKAELRYSSSDQNNRIIIDGNGITIGKVKELKANGKTITGEELSLLDGVKSSKGFLENRISYLENNAALETQIDNASGATGVGTWNGYSPSTAWTPISPPLSVTAGRSGEALILINGNGVNQALNIHGDNRHYLQIRIYHNGTLIETLWNDVRYPGVLNATLDIHKSYIRNVNSGDTFKIEVWRSYSGSYNADARWLGHFTGALNILVVGK